MQWAFLKDTNEKSFAFKELEGICPDCGKEMIPKCGDIIRHHWSHKSISNCDTRYNDGISDWHIDWQNQIKNKVAGETVEVIISTIERYKRADIRTNYGLIIEFQKSPISLSERLERESHYKNMIWVVHSDIKNSKTWSEVNIDIPIIIDADNGLMHYHQKIITFSKTTFINTVINGKILDDVVWAKIKYRFSRKYNNKIIETTHIENVFNYYNEWIENFNREQNEWIFFTDPTNLHNMLHHIKNEEEENTTKELEQVRTNEKYTRESEIIRIERIKQLQIIHAEEVAMYELIQKQEEENRIKQEQESKEWYDNLTTALLAKGYTKIGEVV